jgi:hypothetical protein
MRATLRASVSSCRPGGSIKWPGGLLIDMMHNSRIQSPCAASEHTDSAGSVSQSFHQNLPHGRPDIRQRRTVTLRAVDAASCERV